MISVSRKDVEVNHRHFEKAVERIDRCIELCQNIEEYYYEPELYRRKAMIQLNHLPEEKEKARENLEQAVKKAQKQIGV